MPARSEEIFFPGAFGDRLAANLDLPPGRPRAWALFAHCFTCSKDVFASKRISRALAGRGMAVLRFDFTGLGHSDGEFANTNFSSNVADLVAAADFLRSHHEAPRLLIGHSLGGAAVLMAAAQVPEARAVATIGAPSDPGHVSRHLSKARDTIAREGEAVVEIGGRSFRIRQQFLDDIAKQRMRDAVAKLRRALLIFHAPLDNVVGIDSATRIFQAAKHPKSFVSLDDADHLLSRRDDAVYVADVLAAWAGRYVAGREPAEHQAPEDGAVIVSENGVGRFGQDIAAGTHMLQADEPVAMGGRDSGPTPYQFLSAALGTCTGMTIRMYAARKGWPVEHVAVTVRHDKVHAADCADCETREGKIDLFHRDIRLSGQLDDEQKQRILEIADKCPVHRTLSSEVRVATRLAEEQSPDGGSG